MLTHESHAITYYGEWPDDWQYFFNDDYLYQVTNYNMDASFIEIIDLHTDGAFRIHEKHGGYTEQEALEIIITHWMENEHRS